MRPKFHRFIKKIPLFHCRKYPNPLLLIKKTVDRPYRFGSIYSILDLAMTKRKPARFTAAKVVKANARDRIGQPKPVRILDGQQRDGRQAKHKPSLQDLLRRGE